MKKINVINLILVILSMFFLHLALLLTTIEATAFDLNFYLKEYKKYNIEKETKVSKEKLTYVTQEMIQYLSLKRADLDMTLEISKDKEVPYFNTREKQHMKDVLKLFEKGFFIRNFSLIAFFVIFTYLFMIKNNSLLLYKAMACTSSILLLIVIVGVFFVRQDFYNHFTTFHEIFFTNDLWLLDPRTDRLIQMLPLGFFSDISMRIAINYILEVFLIGIFGFFGIWNQKFER